MIRADSIRLATLVSDLSLDGCCVALSLRIGESVTVELPRIGRLQGQVRWSVGRRTGIRFDRAAPRR